MTLAKLVDICFNLRGGFFICRNASKRGSKYFVLSACSSPSNASHELERSASLGFVPSILPSALFSRITSDAVNDKSDSFSLFALE